MSIKYKCHFDNCDKVFKKSYDLKNHIKRHLNEKSFTCTISNCEFSCIRKDTLNRHLITHTKEKKYKCDICNNFFVRKDYLVTHKKIHNEIKEFNCNICNKSFKTKGTLITHIRTHNGEKPYKCEVENCNKEFSTSSSLNVHKRIHTKERPFNCSFINCKKKFSTTSQLYTHLRIHTGEKPFKCIVENCNSAFTQNSMLQYHIKAIHSEKSLKIQKKSENDTHTELLKYIDNIKREYRINFNCINGTCAKIDYFYCKNDIIFLIENDENQHKSYELSCEIKRMNDCTYVLNNNENKLPIVWIRYNPDTFKINNECQKITKEQRIKKIIEFIEKCIENKDNIPGLSIYYFYYNLNKDKQLCIFDDPDYPEEIKSLVQVIY